jgi:prepilin-type N-terminal cleavage/methylation domain-containing protein
MKLPHHIAFSKPGLAPRARAGFTLVEILISTALFSVLLGGLVYGGVYGAKMCEMTRVKLTRSHEARAVIGKLAGEIRAAKTSWVGSLDGSGVFQAVSDGQPQSGTALLLYPTTNQANFIVYYLNSSDRSFRRTTSAAATPTVLATLVTNSVIFRAQDYLGNVLTNRDNNRVIKVKLEFFQARGQTPNAEYYKLETAVTRRSID